MYFKKYLATVTAMQPGYRRVIEVKSEWVKGLYVRATQKKVIYRQEENNLEK